MWQLFGASLRGHPGAHLGGPGAHRRHLGARTVGDDPGTWGVDLKGRFWCRHHRRHLGSCKACHGLHRLFDFLQIKKAMVADIYHIFYHKFFVLPHISKQFFQFLDNLPISNSFCISYESNTSFCVSYKKHRQGRTEF